MNAEPRKRQGTHRDRKRHWWIRENWYRDVWLFAVTVLVFLTLNSASKETTARRDQTCTVFERAWQTDVKQLTDTYEYLDNLSPQQRREPLSVAIARSLPRLERTVGTPAQGKKKRIVGTEEPPPYCKGKVGLDDSKFLPIPERPPSLR